MKQISIKGRKHSGTVIVDDEDYDELTKYKWHVTPRGYAVGFINGVAIGMHRYLMKPKNRDELVDHINHNTLDNRRSNLRIVDGFTNMQNRAKGRGVVKKSFINKRYYYYAEVRQNHKRYTTTTCDNEEQAKGALKQMLKQLKKDGVI